MNTNNEQLAAVYVRMPPSMRVRLQRAAKRSGRSVSAEAVVAIREHLSAQGAGRKAATP